MHWGFNEYLYKYWTEGLPNQGDYDIIEPSNGTKFTVQHEEKQKQQQQKKLLRECKYVTCIHMCIHVVCVYF